MSQKIDHSRDDEFAREYLQLLNQMANQGQTPEAFSRANPQKKEEYIQGRRIDEGLESLPFGHESTGPDR